MAVTKPNSGDLITETSVTSMYDSVKSRVNSVSTSQFEDACLGEQHLPSIIPKIDGTLTPAADSVSRNTDFDILSPEVSLTGHAIKYETATDVFSDNWREVLTLDNSGAGYLLPPCKILVMCDVTVSKIVKDSVGFTSRNQAWIAVCFRGTNLSTGLIEDHFSPVNMGMVNGWNPDGSGDLGDNVHENMSIWFIIDRTSLSGVWPLSYIQLRATCGYGAGTKGASTDRRLPDKITISNAQLSFCSFYRDA